MGMEKNESKIISTTVVVAVAVAFIIIIIMIAHLQIYHYFRRKLKGTSSVTLSYRPYWKQRPSTESCFFSVSPFHRYLRRHQSSCCGTPLLIPTNVRVCVELLHPYARTTKDGPTPAGTSCQGQGRQHMSQQASHIINSHLHYHGHWGIATILDGHAANATRYRKPNIIIATMVNKKTGKVSLIHSSIIIGKTGFKTHSVQESKPDILSL